MAGLGADRAVPVEAEPGQVLGDCRSVVGAAAGGIEILDAEQEASAGLPRAAPGEQRGPGVAGCRYPVGLGAKRVTVDMAPGIG